MTPAKQIPLSQGLFATVDAADFDWLSQWKWSALKVKKANTVRHYAMRMTRKGEVEGKSVAVLMHRALLRAPKGMVVDHRDNDGLNNQRGNIRVCTQSENMLNCSAHLDARSNFKGVSFNKGLQKWTAEFRGDYIGTFPTEEAAAIAYNKTAKGFDPAFAKLNDIQEAA